MPQAHRLEFGICQVSGGRCRIDPCRRQKKNRMQLECTVRGASARLMPMQYRAWRHPDSIWLLRRLAMESLVAFIMELIDRLLAAGVTDRNETRDARKTSASGVANRAPCTVAKTFNFVPRYCRSPAWNRGERTKKIIQSTICLNMILVKVSIVRLCLCKDIRTRHSECSSLSLSSYFNLKIVYNRYLFCAAIIFPNRGTTTISQKLMRSRVKGLRSIRSFFFPTSVLPPIR